MRPPEDVQAALTVLGARPTGVEGEGVIDLRRTNLGGAELDELNFEGADLRKADLTRATLFGGRFADVWFDDGDLTEADLTAGDFENSTFLSSNLKKATMVGGNFLNSEFTSADMSGADLSSGEGEEETKLGYAKLSGVNLADAQSDRRHPLCGRPERGSKRQGAGRQSHPDQSECRRPDRYFP
ncbi:pentapeptide repeat-containing protein [Streptomyces sp. NPDC051662]|uniref:pentapeptide repeat-containing protein n=1 Tax=Streptomyces sp. NPDC051662 TaxID=3154750 RepID=UPI00343C3E10